MVGLGVEVVLESELPGLHSALRLASVPVSVVLDPWLRQCFLNILDLPEVAQYVLFSLLYGADYIVYFCVSVLSHLQPLVLAHEGEAATNLYQKLITHQLTGFHSGDYLPFMDKLAAKYKSVLLQYFTDCIHS